MANKQATMCHLKINMSVFIILIFLCVEVFSDLNDECLTPNNEKARCVSIFSCNVMLQNLKNRTEDSQKFFIASTCGTNGAPHYDPLVCCGSVAKYIQINKSESTPSISTRLKKLNGTEKLKSLLPSNCGFNGFKSRIIGGEETQLDEYPWMARLEYIKNNASTGFNCGGFLINSKYILTAAHCVVGEVIKVIGYLYSVRLGEHDSRTNPDTREGQGTNEPYVDILIESAIAHKQYLKNLATRADDIALVRLSEEVVFSDYRHPICLPINGEKATSTDELFVAGWGATDPSYVDPKFSPVKLAVNVTIYDQEKCKEIFTITENQLCAGGEDGKDSCRGDSGGPLMNAIPNTLLWYAEGIVSYGVRHCGTADRPGVYIRVSSYLDWIQENIKD